MINIILFFVHISLLIFALINIIMLLGRIGDNMFNYAGYNATTFSITIPQTNGNGINNDTTHMYESTSSTYASPPTSRTFTVASS